MKLLRKAFQRQHYPADVILQCVRWYLAYALSLRNLEEMMAERGVSVDHSTLHPRLCRISGLADNLSPFLRLCRISGTADNLSSFLQRDRR